MMREILKCELIHVRIEYILAGRVSATSTTASKILLVIMVYGTTKYKIS